MENRLLSCRSLSEFLTMFFGLGLKEKISIFTEEVTVSKGSCFYRIRRVEGFDNTNYNDPKEWEPVPKTLAKQGRFNAKNESVLYVASHADFLEREVRLKENEEYYLAKYVCKNTFKVGSFLGVNSQVNSLIHKIAMSVFGSEDLTEAENLLIDDYLKNAKYKSLNELSTSMLASLYIYKFIPQLYDVTNKLGRLVLIKNDFGIRYSSVYVPIELSGAPQIITFNGVEYGNYVLTEKGYKNIEFVSAEKRSYSPTGGLEVMIDTFAKLENEDK